MPVLKTAPSRILGFDIAKDTIAVFDSHTQRPCVIDNRRAAISRLIAGLDPQSLAVCEPTGGHESLLLQMLVDAGIACHRADTVKVKAFIRSFGILAKSDAIDARGLALYGKERWNALALFAPPQADQHALRQLVTRRQELVTLKVAEQNRARAPGRAAVKASCKAMLRAIERQIARIQMEIETLLHASQPLRRRVALFQTLPGVGPRTATGLAAFMPELGHLSRRQAASLAGVAPHPRDSGTRKGYRAMRGGRPGVRAILYMAALSATRAKGPLRPVYQRLIENGKKPIVAIAALMRKIIVILNARLRDQIQQQS